MQVLCKKIYEKRKFSQIFKLNNNRVENIIKKTEESMYLPNPLPWEGCDTRSIFMQPTAG